MVAVTIYTKGYCPYCHDAKALLKEKGATFTEFDVTADKDRHREMVARANGRTTVPQIFIGDTHVGGCDDIYALEARGGLDPLLKGA
jgi:glutaredoxin 3